MVNEAEAFYKQVNFTRYNGQVQGHYESFFIRANHPTNPVAFWIRYTIFCPKDHPEKALGELWAIFFNGQSHHHTVAKEEFPLADCLFDPADFNIQVGSASLHHGNAKGSVGGHKGNLSWDLSFGGDAEPLLLLPLHLYDGKFPAAKSLVSLPMAHFNGTLTVNDENINVENWIGSQNHNWGSRHTDLYAWGQVAGFDNAPESFLELATARLRLGFIWSPPMTPVVLRHEGKQYALNSPDQAIRKAHGRFDYFTWQFKTGNPKVEITGMISASHEAFVGLSYYNPPGGTKNCLNSKIAACRVQILDKATGTRETLQTKNRAAFEILTSDRTHGVPILA